MQKISSIHDRGEIYQTNNKPQINATDQKTAQVFLKIGSFLGVLSALTLTGALVSQYVPGAQLALVPLLVASAVLAAASLAFCAIGYRMKTKTISSDSTQPIDNQTNKTKIPQVSQPVSNLSSSKKEGQVETSTRNGDENLVTAGKPAAILNQDKVEEQLQVEEIDEIESESIEEVDPDDPYNSTNAELVFNCGASLNNSFPYVELNFAVIKNENEQKLVPVTRNPYEFKQKYKIYEGSDLEALLFLAQDSQGVPGRGFPSRSLFSTFLNHPGNKTITEADLLKVLLEKDQKNTSKILTLNSNCTLEILKMIKEKNIPFDVNEKDSKGKTLFSKETSYYVAFEVMQALVEIDPAAIKQVRDIKKSLFVKFVCDDKKDKAEFILKAMEAQNVPLTLEESWVKKALENDCTFSDEEFAGLDQEIKNRFYFAANALGQEELVKKLNLLGMKEKPIFADGPGIFAYNMDFMDVRDGIENFLKTLRKDKLLLTHDEFAKLDRAKYMAKSDQIGRILGKNFIEKIVEENGLKHIKVPKKIAVLNEGVEEATFHINDCLEIMPKNEQMTIYAERIKKVNRNISLEEAIEWMIAIEKTGFNDFAGENFFICEDGIYFIDTEFTNFTPERPSFNAIQSLADFLNPEDVEKFEAEFQKRFSDYNAKMKAEENPPEVNNFTEASTYKKFNFLVSSL